jgi:hypothetical protein
MTASPRKLSDHIEIGRRFLRSVNLEKDFNDDFQNGDYIITTTGRRVLQQLAEGLEDNSAYRAWTITGPYGVGKSAFGVFVTKLLCGGDSSAAGALRKLAAADPARAREYERFRRFRESRKPFYPLLITARRAPASLCLLEAVLSAVTQFRNEAAIGLAQKVGLLVKSAEKGVAVDSRHVLGCIDSLSRILAKRGHSGVLFLVDEMGKLFEYAAYRPQGGDVFVLQELAEYASRSAEFPVLILGLLHQSFEEYGRHLDRTSRNEWAKVQGRFQDVAFLEPPEQVLRMIGSAIRWRSGKIPSTLARRARELAQLAIDCQICPPAMRPEEFLEVSLKAYPLHPAALVALPHLFHRFAQNERSLFSYLSSQEPNGFQSFLRTHALDARDPAYIRLTDLFDYFIVGFGSGLFRHPHARRWLEAAEVLDRVDNLTELQKRLIKTIGILSTLGMFSHLNATRGHIASAIAESGKSEAVQQCLTSLVERSILTFRRFNETYRIWEGSDVDVEERITEGQRHTRADLRLAAAIERYLPPRPIVARRHSFETGSLKFFKIRYVDDQADLSREVVVDPEACAVILVVLSMSSPQLEEMRRVATEIDRPNCLVAIPQEIGELRSMVVELTALQWAWENTPELRDDRVARRELAMRISDVQQSLQRGLTRLLDPRSEPIGSSCVWYWQREKRRLRSPVEVAHLLSDVCDRVYSQCPRIHNELITRRTLSSAAAAARRNLVERMIGNVGQDLLGLDGYPPERSMFESVLRVSGLYRCEVDGRWIFGGPPDDDPCRLKPVWQKLQESIFRDDPEPTPVQKVFTEIGQPPFGVPDGLHPVLLCAFLSAYRSEITLYREGTFVPEPAVTDFEILMRRPELFAVAGSRLSAGRAAVVQRIASGLSVEPATVPVVRALFRNAKGLPEFARSTMKLSSETIAMRQAFSTAQSPEQFLFNELPRSLGVKPFASDGLVRSHIDAFFTSLNRSLSEWGEATQRAVDAARDFLLESCGLPVGEEGWQKLRETAQRVESIVVNPTLLPFIQRVARSTNDPSGRESVLGIVANRPPQTWTDDDVDRFPGAAKAIGGLFKAALRDFDAAMAPELLTPVERQKAEQLANDLEHIFRASTEPPTRPVILAAIALLAQRVAPAARRDEE